MKSHQKTRYTYKVPREREREREREEKNGAELQKNSKRVSNRSFHIFVLTIE
jgi:hypothetical protein